MPATYYGKPPIQQSQCAKRENKLFNVTTVAMRPGSRRSRGGVKQAFLLLAAFVQCLFYASLGELDHLFETLPMLRVLVGLAVHVVH